MTLKYPVLRRLLALLLALSLALAGVPAGAVVKNVQVVDAEGQPVANQTVTIVFPDGTEEEEETDDRGILVFDFPGKGDYVIRHAGGQMPVSVGGGVSAAALATGGVIAAGVIAAVALGDDDDDDPPSGGSGTPGGPNPPPSGNVDPCQGDSFNFINGLTANVVSNPGNHPNNFSGDWEIFCDPGADPRIINVDTPPMSVEWSCPLGTGNSCNAQASCFYAGFNTTCELDSSFTETNWSGQMTAGSDGALPGGEPITVSFDVGL